MKKQKTSLRKDSVNSDSFHVGIELELIAPGSGGGESEHDDDACHDDRYSRIQDLSETEILRDFIGLRSDYIESVRRYFNFDAWRDNEWENDPGCDGDCDYYSDSDGDGSEVRYALEKKLRELTGNTSFKVVSDGSLTFDESEETDAEVCWNYFASKETIRDNAKILELLRNEGCDFNTSCGLHINLNNYLNVPGEISVPTSELEFLFNIVAPSRRTSNYCSEYAVSTGQKYSMIYHQGDRFEFRFFSPTLDAEKLNHYVTLANTVYRRLAGKDAKLPKKTMRYLLDKMRKVNGHSFEIAADTLKKVNSIKSLETYRAEQEAERQARIDAGRREDEEAERQAQAEERQILASLGFDSMDAFKASIRVSGSLGCGCDDCVTATARQRIQERRLRLELEAGFPIPSFAESEAV